MADFKLGESVIFMDPDATNPGEKPARVVIGTTENYGMLIMVRFDLDTDEETPLQLTRDGRLTAAGPIVVVHEQQP